MERMKALLIPETVVKCQKKKQEHKYNEIKKEEPV